MQRIVSSLAASAGLAALLCAASVSYAAPSNWVFSGTGTTDSTSKEPLATTGYSVGSGTSTVNLNISGVYALNGTDNNGFGGNWQTNTPNASPLYWSGNGVGMCSDPTNKTPTANNPACEQPNHALDNNGNTEGILLTFSKSVILTSVGIGYISGDADISVFRYVGDSAPTMNGAGATLSAMTTAGWKLVGNYANLNSDEDSPYNLINGANAAGEAGATSVGSSWWLITAYNTSYGTPDNGMGQGNDYFKLFAVSSNVCTTGKDCGDKKVSEPGSIALAGLALFGLFFGRRQAQQRCA